MNIFEESIVILKSKVQIRKLFQDMHSEDVQRILNRLETIYEEKLLTCKEAEKEQSRKIEAVQAVAKQMQELGLSMDDIKVLTGSKTIRKGKPRQRFLFRYENTEGASVDWEGAKTGRIPTVFSKYLERTGKVRQACIVSEL